MQFKLIVTKPLYKSFKLIDVDSNSKISKEVTSQFTKSPPFSKSKSNWPPGHKIFKKFDENSGLCI